MASEVDRSAGRPPHDSNSLTSPADARRIRIFRGLIGALLVGLVVSLAYVQLERSAEYAALGRHQSQRRVIVPAPRGAIYDREHRLLAGNKLRVAAVLNLGELRKEVLQDEPENARTDKISSPSEAAARARFRVLQRQLDRVNAITGHRVRIDPLRLERAYAHERVTPFVLDSDMTEEQGDRLVAQRGPSDLFEVVRSNQRWYPEGRTAAHVLGRVRSEMTAPRSERPAEEIPALKVPVIAGDSGIEKQYDAQLGGHPGEAVVSVDALGFLVGPANQRRAATSGDELLLSLDLDLQGAAERAIAATPVGPRGAAVAIAVKTGEVLVLASKPDFDPNDASLAVNPDQKQRIEAESGWFNRATQGLYPPGSTFKIFTALAGLRRGTLHPEDLVHCDGFYEVGGQRFLCHNAEGHGDVSLRSALAQSCNVFAYKTGLAAGPEALAEEARRFHLDEPTHVDLPSESSRMLVPDPAWKREDGRGDWTTGDTINLSIGQGFLRYSPLQAACAMASLARRETLTVPTLLHQPGRNPSGDRKPEPLGLRDADYAALIDGLQAVIQTGIGQNAQVPGISIAGKTGTAQVKGPEGTTDVAWFVAFAPVERPEIAVAVAIEGDQPGVEFAGAEYAAPVVREIIGSYFDKRAKR
jgi:penicillin-binding protein 2